MNNGKSVDASPSGQSRPSSDGREAAIFTEALRTLLAATHAVDQMRLVAASASQLAEKSDARLASIEARVASLEQTLVTVVQPLTQQLRQLEERHTDLHIVRPFLLDVIEILDRLDVELTDAEKSSPQIAFVEECRAADRIELENILRRRGVERFTASPGDRFDSSTCTICSVRPARTAERVGRVFRVEKPGYWRVSDRFVIRPCFVHVFRDK